MVIPEFVGSPSVNTFRRVRAKKIAVTHLFSSWLKRILPGSQYDHAYLKLFFGRFAPLSPNGFFRNPVTVGLRLYRCCPQIACILRIILCPGHAPRMNSILQLGHLSSAGRRRRKLLGGRKRGPCPEAGRKGRGPFPLVLLIEGSDRESSDLRSRKQVFLGHQVSTNEVEFPSGA